ncbi:MAG: hypothetical protein J5883_01395 [Clostridiales bacterium]|nr:hypothetical protein [Clostridiales bacterium]
MNNNKIKLLILCVAGSVLLAACSFDADRAGSALYDLGSNLNDAVEGGDDEEKEVIETAAPAETAETEEETEPSETQADPTSTPVPTATPMPTATPAPERVDLSELTEDTISDGITVEDEAFEEHYVDGSNTTVASFSGNRILVQIDDAPNVQTSVNLLLDGFYQEAAGLYSRYTNEALSEVALEGGAIALPDDDEEPSDDAEEPEDADTEETDTALPSDGSFDPYVITVSYDHSTNGRVLSVIMSYTVTRGDETVASTTEYMNIDLYTGQFIIPSVISDDPDALNEALLAELANSPAAQTSDADDEDDDEDEAEDEEADIGDVTQIFIMTEEAGTRATYAEIIGITEDGTVRRVVDLQDYSQYFNRYGRIVFGLDN